jgi:hypothetical protein
MSIVQGAADGDGQVFVTGHEGAVVAANVTGAFWLDGIHFRAVNQRRSEKSQPRRPEGFRGRRDRREGDGYHEGQAAAEIEPCASRRKSSTETSGPW